MVFSKAGNHTSPTSTDQVDSIGNPIGAGNLVSWSIQANDLGPIGAGNLAKSGIPVEPAVKGYKSVNPLNERVNGEMGRNTDGTVKRPI